MYSKLEIATLLATVLQYLWNSYYFSQNQIYIWGFHRFWCLRIHIALKATSISMKHAVMSKITLFCMAGSEGNN